MYIDPCDTKEIIYWTKKLGVTPAELYNAILETGSNNASTLNDYLHRKNNRSFSIGNIIQQMAIKLNLVH